MEVKRHKAIVFHDMAEAVTKDYAICRKLNELIQDVLKN